MADNKIGKISTGMYLRIGIGDGEASNGKEFELSVTVASYEPLVICGKRTFHLSWNDICNLAEQAGLFEDEADPNNAE